MYVIVYLSSHIIISPSLPTSYKHTNTCIYVTHVCPLSLPPSTHTQLIRHRIVRRCHCCCCDRVSSSECNDIHSWLWSWSDSNTCLPEDIQTDNRYVLVFVNKYAVLFVNKYVYLLVNKYAFLFALYKVRFSRS